MLEYKEVEVTEPDCDEVADTKDRRGGTEKIQEMKGKRGKGGGGKGGGKQKKGGKGGEGKGRGKATTCDFHFYWEHLEWRRQDRLEREAREDATRIVFHFF